MTSLSAADELARSRLFEQPLWYAGCTASRHEKTVAQHLQQRGIEHFLPLYDAVHRWKNGRHHLQLPLFPGYIFVHLPLRERLRVLEVPGFAHLIGFSGIPFPLDDTEIDAMRTAIASGTKAKPYPYLKAGTRVDVCRGPLEGMTGYLLRRHGLCRIVLSVDLIMRSMVVEVDAADVVPRKGPESHVSEIGSLRPGQNRVYA